MGAYLDHNATTPLDMRVLAEMMPYMKWQHGNASSLHRHGRIARQAVERAREQVAALVGAHPSEVIFTSGGTEANNLAITGFHALHASVPILCSAVEHASVLEPVRTCHSAHADANDRLPVDEAGRLRMPDLAKTVADRRCLVAVMMANNETGVIQDIEAVGAVVRDSQGWLHCDAVQAAGKTAVNFRQSGAHMMSISAHKLHGPKGVGALIRDRSVPLTPIVHGGDQESGLRAGTENVAAIVGFGKAAELAAQELTAHQKRMLQLRTRLESRLRDIPAIRIFAAGAQRLCNTVCFAVPGVDGESLLMMLDEHQFAVSSGSACHSQRHEPSHVLLAMGVDVELARRAIRVSVGPDNEVAEIDEFVDCLHGLLNTAGNVMASAWA